MRTRDYILGSIIVLTCSCGPRFAPMEPVISAVPAEARAASADRAPGPLSVTRVTPEAPEQVKRERWAWQRSVYMSEEAIREDTRVFLKVVDTLFPDPPTERISEGVRISHQHAEIIERLAPYSLDSVIGSFSHSVARLGMCVRAQGIDRHCWIDLEVHSQREGPPFELTAHPSGVVELTFHYLSSADDPGWEGFPEALEKISGARGLVLDLRLAVGADPRPVVPLLETITGRAPLKPLRQVRRPKTLDPYVEEYAVRFFPESRDPEVWRDLVGDIPERSGGRDIPISVVVGEHTGAAAELAARVLQTYSGAVLYGDVMPHGRLERDEPALLVLPRSKARIYFNATEYLLNEEIEAITGPTADWWTRLRDTYAGDLAEFAVRETSRLLEDGPRPRCDSLPGFDDPDEIPQDVRARIHNPGSLTFSCNKEIVAYPNVPFSTLRRFASTCTPKMTVYDQYNRVALPGTATLPQLTRLAASGLVDRIDIDCEILDQPH